MSTDSKNKYKNLHHLLTLFDDTENSEIFDMEPNSFKDKIMNFIANNQSSHPVQPEPRTSINNDAFSETTDFKSIQRGIKTFIIALCSGLGNNASLDVILKRIQINLDTANKKPYDFDTEFLDRIPPEIMTQEKVLILLLYFLHNTNFNSE